MSIFLFVVIVVALLAALNAASYVKVEREPELEAAPDRSTSNAGPTGTRAIYEYLEASGRRVMRWRATGWSEGAIRNTTACGWGPPRSRRWGWPSRAA